MRISVQVYLARLVFFGAFPFSFGADFPNSCASLSNSGSLAKSARIVDLRTAGAAHARGGAWHHSGRHFSHLSVDLRDLCVEEQPHRVSPQRHDDARVHDLDLVLKIIACAGFDLTSGNGSRLPGGRHLTTLVIHTSARSRPPVPAADQGFPEAPTNGRPCSSSRTGSFPDEHDLGMRGTLSWHRVLRAR